MSRSTMLDKEMLLEFLLDSDISMKERATLLRKLYKVETIKTFDDLIFSIHPYNHLNKGLKRECLLYFTNGYGINVIEVNDIYFPYLALRLNRQGNELTTTARIHNFKYYDIQCKNEEEVSEVMLEMQEKPILLYGDIAIVSAVNYLETLHNGK